MAKQQALFLTNVVDDPLGLFDDLYKDEVKLHRQGPQDEEVRTTPEFPVAGVVLALREGSVMEGKLSFDEPVRIDGRLTGSLLSSSLLVVGGSAEVFGTINAQKVEVWGYVRGNIFARELVVVRAGGCLLGNIHAPQIFVEQGGIFEGWHGAGKGESSSSS